MGEWQVGDKAWCIKTERGYLYLNDVAAGKLGITPPVDRWITPLEVTDAVVQVSWLNA